MFNNDLIQRAWNFASEKHRDQKVPGTELSYLNHVGNVTLEVMSGAYSDMGLDVGLSLTCAILHDTIEDTDATYDEIRSIFGVGTADGVLALTKDNTLPDKMAQMKDSLMRIKTQPKEVWIVKLADRITNLQTPPAYWSIDKIKSYKAEAELILTELRPSSVLLGNRLADKINNYMQYE